MKRFLLFFLSLFKQVKKKWLDLKSRTIQHFIRIKNNENLKKKSRY